MYTRLYHFTEKPFNLTPDPRFLFMTPQHREALASMIYGIRERRGFISVTGEVGTGKTTLIYTLLNNLSEKVKTVFIYHTNTTFEQLLKNILLELGVDVGDQDKLTLLRKLNTYLIAQLDQQATVAVIIDEAQNLSKNVLEELRMLSNLETCKTKLLQLLLIGQPELEVKLNSPDLRQLKQRIGIRRQIKPLSTKECRQYIEHRLHLVGSTTSKVFTQQAISMVCKHSKGIPRNINVICENAFLIGYSLSKKKIDGQVIKEVINDMSGSLVQLETPEVNSYFIPNFRILSMTAVVLLTFGALAFIGTEYIKYRNPDAGDMNTSKKSFVSPRPAYSDVLPGSDGTGGPGDASTGSRMSGTQSADRFGDGSKIMEIVTVKDNNTISSLAEKYYGQSNETLMDIILSANPTITDVNHIYKNQQIIIPEITYDTLIIKLPDDTYKIHVGTYSSLRYARGFYYDHTLMGKDVDILLRRVSDNENWYKVVLSSYDTRDECIKTLETLRNRGLLPISF
ncbi:MAG TPA: AAA family ATPase [Deltaproteobacteria bacterium]|nr:AAA family ATPase [Deltaproteobacteria bacterium]HPJ94459.1 AAA family ATPase [Deltaproteobacteria bacterium]HPR52032.1 AAA family ATPase [Deltaproteobacteria bacterium]